MANSVYSGCLLQSQRCNHSHSLPQCSALLVLYVQVSAIFFACLHRPIALALVCWLRFPATWPALPVRMAATPQIPHPASHGPTRRIPGLCLSPRLEQGPSSAHAHPGQPALPATSSALPARMACASRQNPKNPKIKDFARNATSPTALACA